MDSSYVRLDGLGEAFVGLNNMQWPKTTTGVTKLLAAFCIQKRFLNSQVNTFVGFFFFFLVYRDG